MESAENFIEVFEKWKRERNDGNLRDILMYGPSCLQNLSTNEIGLVLSLLLNDKRGLLHFLGNASDRAMENSIVEGFKLLTFIVQQFYWLLDQYVTGIKKVCQSAIITKCSQRIKTTAVDCFQSLVKKCPSKNLNLRETVQIFVGNFHLCSETDRVKYFKALEVVPQYHPEVISSAQCTTIFERVMSDFDQRLSKCKSGSQPNELATYLDLLKNMLTNFSPRESQDKSKEYYKKLYGYIKELSNIDITQTKKFVSRAGIALLGRHMSLFAEYVYEDALYWHDTLLKWSKLKSDNGVVATNTLSVYYQTMGNILKSTDTESSRQIFQHLMRYFENKFTNYYAESIDLQSSIHGFGQMAGPCRNYLAEKEVTRMFSLIARRTTVMYVNNKTNGLLENVEHYQVALSEILLYMSDITTDQLTSLSMLSLVLIKRFPELSISGQSLAVKSLMKTICNVRQACRRWYEEFIQSLVYEGIIWSCSHTPFIDAEREREMKNLNERPVCYKNYLPLWIPLSCGSSMDSNIDNSTITMQIFTNMIDTCVKLINKLNLDVQTLDSSSETEVFDIPVAVNDTDFRVFINLVDLFVAILTEVEPILIECKMNWFFYEVIKKSKQNPLISGFYKLVHVVLKLCNLSADSPEQQLQGEMFKLVSQYLSDTIDILPSFSGELQTSCFNMIFATPVAMVEKMLDRLAGTFKAAFSAGQSNFDLAQSALCTIEKWNMTITGKQMTKFLIDVVPSLEAFLQSDESMVDLVQENLQYKRKVIKNIVLSDHEKTLKDFQKRILLFFGSLNSQITMNFAHEQPTYDGVLRDNKNLLKYTLLYQDIRPDIYLDTILPRTIELALNSTDRRTRVVACEVLHSIVIVMLGRTMQFLASNPDHLLPIFEKICPALLKLGSDSDMIVHQLFNPLMIQLTHWYSSKIMLRSSETICLIETLFDLLTYESNIALTDFCGVCLAEFLKWSIKQSTDTELQTSSTNVATIISKITNFALHPSAQKRIGAAVAFNYLYAILRESDVIIDIFWLELLFCFIKSLDTCNSSEILKSLKHIARVIDNKSDLLNVTSSRRRKPAEFKGTLLKDAGEWLLVQCGSLDHNCRSQSMAFIKMISQRIPEFGSMQKLFSDYIQRNSMRGLNQIILRELRPKIETLYEENVKPLLRTLDCYIWILNENIINLELLFTDKNANKDMIFNSVINFVYLINVKGEKNENLSEFAKQYQELCILKCKIILMIFDFIKILLNKIDTQADRNSSSYIPTFFWNDELYSLISASMFKPKVIGFNLQHLELLESLPSSLEQLLNTLVKKLDNKHLQKLRETITKDIETRFNELLDINAIFNTGTSITLKYYIKGLIMLETLDECDKLYTRPLSDTETDNKVTEIFNLLRKQRYDEVVSVNLESDEKEYFEHLLEFLYLRFGTNTLTTLVNIVDSKTELTHKNSATIFHGDYFIKLFGTQVFQGLLKHFATSMNTLLSNTFKEKFDTVLIILVDLLTYVKNNRKTSEPFLAELELEFVHRFSAFRSMLNYVERRKEKVITLYSLLEQVSRDPSELCREPNELYSWIMQELLGYLDLEYKTRILNSFLPCVVDDTPHKVQELTRCLYKLKTDYYPVNINNLVKGSLEHSNVLACFQTLAHHLPVLKSVILFDCVIHITIGNVAYFWDEDSIKYLTIYFKEISTADSQKSLEVIYKYFMNTENFNARLEILKKLLCVCIQICNADAVELFYEENIKSIYEIVSQDISGNGSGLKNLLVSKIGCYNLLGIMFAKIPLQKLNTADSKIVKNAIDTIVTGRELFQALNANVLAVRKLKSNAESTELMRLLHCAAYNCSIAIVSLKCEERFYILPFAEKRSEGQLIWENIIDSTRRYEFKQDFQQIPKESRSLINIRKRCNLKQAQDYSCIKSYDLAASTLNEDLACFDLHEANLRPHPDSENLSKEEMMSMTFESDDFNNHECMATICGLITHMVSSNIFNLPNHEEDLPMPKWMQYFRSSLNIVTIYNVKFFMIKVIVNTQKVFRPYGKSFLTSILNFLNLHFRSNFQMNYIIKDILVMLIDWHNVVIPSEYNDKRLAQNLLEMLMKNADSHQRHIYKNNVKFIESLVEVWQSCVEVPEGILNIPNTSPKFTVRMILIFLLNNKQESLVSKPNILKFLINSFNEDDEEIAMHVCNAFGLILKFFESENMHDLKQETVNNITTSFIDKSHENHNKYIKCIYEIHKFYPNIINHHFKQLTTKFFKVDNTTKEQCLELFLSALPHFTKKEILTELGYMKFRDILINKILTCQNVAMKIINKLLYILSPSEYLPLAQLLIPYSKDGSLTQRELVMDIFIAVYRMYWNNIEDNIDVSKLKDLSRYVLLVGLLDANESLQQKLLQFWTSDGNMADKSIERILQIFDMYNTNMESSYLSILPFMMLHLVSKAPEFEKKMFEPLINCKFEDYEIAIRWRSKHAELAAPLFTSSLATQMSQYYAQSNPTFARFNRSLNQSLFLRATHTLQFKQTLSKDQSFVQRHHALANEYDDSAGDVKIIPQPSENKKSTRLLQNAADVRDSIRHQQISKYLRRDEILKEEVDRQRNSITMYRKYTIGDFPDTQILHSSLIKPLQQLAKHDQVIARHLTVAMFCSMLEEMLPNQKQEFLQKLSVSLNHILVNSQGSKPLVATVLEIILNSYDIYVSPNVIANVSKSCGLLSLGALLLEEKMTSGYTTENSASTAKRSKYAFEVYGEDNDWLQLANLYKSMNEFDVVQSIFGCNKFGGELQEATLAQSANNWIIAREAYAKACESNEGLTKDYCQESLFICLAHLSNWKQIVEYVETELQMDYDALWQKPITENWKASWVLQAQIHEMVQNADYKYDRFPKALDNWVKSKDKLLQLKSFYGEEIAVFYINQNPQFSENCITSRLDIIRQEWKHLNPLYSEQKVNKYLALCGLSDLKTYLRSIQDKNQLIPNVRNLLDFWNNSTPENQDNLLLWDKHITYRLYLFDLLTQQFNVEESNEESEILDKLNDIVVTHCLNIAQIAYSQNNLHFMKQYLKYSESYRRDDNVNLLNEWSLAFAKFKYLSYAYSKTPEKRMKSYIESWTQSHNLISDATHIKLRNGVRQHISTLVIELQKLVIKSEPIGHFLLEHESISEHLSTLGDKQTIVRELSDYCLTKLRECNESADAETRASCYLKVSKYCHSMNGYSEIDLGLDKEFVHSTLTAMSYGSIEASQYFPCLLHLEYSTNPELQEVFQRACENVETWMFLKWQAQLLSHVGTAISLLIAPILLRLAETYPNSLIYSFRMTKEMNKSLSNHPILGKLTQILSENKDLELFLEAMKFVVQPELYLKYLLNELDEIKTVNPSVAVDTILTTLYPNISNDGKLQVQGKVYKVIAKFEQKVKEMREKEGKELFICRQQISNNLDELLKSRIKGTCRLALKDYSPWLHKFSGGVIEVPGQYAGDTKPMPQYHKKIVKLNPTVTILPSLRKPIRITILCNDGKNYNFLVKFGEDLRLDERIEQLFMLMNKILQGDIACRQRRLSINTYLVIPLTGSHGLIQWIDNTRSLDEIINSVLTDQQKIERQNIISSYISWLSSAATGGSIEAKYKQAILKYSRAEAITKFNQLKNRIDCEVLRNSFKRLSSSPESFFAIRQNFITSYATICVAHWILGIGDRNLSNILISCTSGKALGIDFGYSFDAAVDSSLPELTPFRLTPQILGLLRPFDENGLLKVTMINVLRALKHGRDPLLACMDIFIKEPSLDWLARRKVLEDQEKDLDLMWYPKKKIDIVMQKLNGTKSSNLTLLQIKDRYGGTEYFSKYIDIVNGLNNGLQVRVRSQRNDEHLSIEEQVECLLDQATDPNILVRAWYGWEPWI